MLLMVRGVMKTRGFTLIELLIVVAIIGLLAAAAVVAVTSAAQRSRQSRTMGDMRTVALALQSYGVDMAYYPHAADAELRTMKQLLAPTYIRVLPVNDGWSRPLRYASDGVVYTLVSYGGDGLPSPPYTGGRTHGFADDIVLVGGRFFQWPEGVQE